MGRLLNEATGGSLFELGKGSLHAGGGRMVGGGGRTECAEAMETSLHQGQREGAAVGWGGIARGGTLALQTRQK